MATDLENYLTAGEWRSWGEITSEQGGEPTQWASFDDCGNLIDDVILTPLEIGEDASVTFVGSSPRIAMNGTLLWKEVEGEWRQT